MGPVLDGLSSGPALVLHDTSGGWKAELNWYLKDPAINVKKDENTVAWWGVSIN